MAKLMEYVLAAVIPALPALALVGLYMYPAKEPQLSPSGNPSAMVWSYPGEYQARNFKDVKPYGSLDEVVLRTHDGKVVTLRPNEKGFQEQERVYKEKIVPYLNE
ncbi:hypothetical protein HYX12_00340 [Candidatus Woesearchaeota archaeon]|nr:hypothetical protein [Candidatus Woesearchaeota archaeon]